MNARELEMHMRGKKQLYMCLIMEGKCSGLIMVMFALLLAIPHHSSVAQVYLPPENDCTVTFMQLLMSGRKKVRRSSMKTAPTLTMSCSSSTTAR